ncbi:MAG TPA: CHRD domain-containing protein [Candidatus Acidoferrum sp.]|nr:CHRD domain-containing protein [Candidatus Acidoferrum sp.]
MNKFRFALLGVSLAGILAATASAATPTTITIKMVAQNDSGENGTAVLTQVDDGTRVEVKLDGTPKDVAQPTHIHVGNCGHINKAPEYPLTSTTNGAGVSTVKGVQLADLLKGTYAINVHKSASELGTYVSCGNIAAPSGSM